MQVKEMTRERSFSWPDPKEVVRHIVGREHLTWLQQMLEGTIPPPPAARLLNMHPELVEAGHVVFAARAEEWMANPAGVIHGGMTSTLLDTVLTLAVMSQLPREKICTTIDLNVHFIRPLFPDGQKIIADGVAVHVGTTVGTAEGRVYDARGKVVAHGTASLAIVDTARLKPESP
jgi:uncharacterized protein (TIGR00369 family)